MNRTTKRHRKIALIFAVITLIPALVSCTADVDPAGVLRLSEGGESAWRVVISREASDDTKTIAEEFIGYFEQITGAALPLVRDDTNASAREIVIGKTSRTIDRAVDYSALGEEELVCLAKEKSLLLSGATDRAVAYAVYDFLEDQCGVRYWSADYETVPKTPTLDIPDDLCVTDAPVFWFRSMNEIGADDPKWMVKMRLNSRESLGSERFHRDPFVGGGEGYAEWYVHTIAKLAEMGKEDPERQSFTNLQPCLTDETVYQTVLKNVRAWLDTYPDATIISISQNDGTAESAMCTCLDCKEIYNKHGKVQSALWVSFVSRVANELADEYPDVYFDTLAYNFTTLAPTGLEIPDNVIIRIAPAHACINHDYKDVENCLLDLNPEERASAKFATAMEEWKEIAPHRFVWDYNCLFYNYWAPQTNFSYVYDNLRNYAEDGIEGVFIQGNTSGSNGFSELRAYLVAKCLWDPDMSEEAFNDLMLEFMENYYGQGTSEPLMDYIRLIETENRYVHFSLYGYQFKNFLPLSVTVDEEGVARLDKSLLIDPAKECFDRAEACELTDEQRLHLRKARMQIKYYEAMANYEFVYQIPEGTTPEIDYEARRALNESLYNDAIACGVSEMCEGLLLTSDPNLNYAPIYWER